MASLIHPIPVPLYTGETFCLNGNPLNPTRPVVSGPDERLISWIVPIVMQLFGVHAVNVEPLDEGERNKAFLVRLPEVGRTAHIPVCVVFRISKASKAQYFTNCTSEAHTMMYIRQTIGNKVPVPRVYAYSDDGYGPSYIIMEYINGVRLRDLWDTLAPPQKLRAIRAYAELFYHIASFRNPTIGSIQEDRHGEFVAKGLSVERLPRIALTEQAIRHDRDPFDEPFTSIKEWLMTTEKENKRFLIKHPDLTNVDGDTREECEENLNRALKGIQGMLEVIPHVFQDHEDWEPDVLGSFALFPGRFDGGDILVRSSGPDIGLPIAVIDWEESGFYPVCKAMNIPEWLRYAPDGSERPDLDWSPYRHAFFDTIKLMARKDDILVKMFDDRYRLLTLLVNVARTPWYEVGLRERCVELCKKEHRQVQVHLLLGSMKRAFQLSGRVSRAGQ